MDKKQIKQVQDAILEAISLPDTAKTKAKERFEDIGKWLTRDESCVAIYTPALLNQGSFRLGTTIRPVSGDDDFDLDVSCKFQSGITRETITQEKLRQLLHKEIRAYATARGIKHNVTEKHRCCRLEYQDNMSFHIDLVPCIPAHHEWDVIKLPYYQADLQIWVGDKESAKYHEVYITDDRSQNYSTISEDWILSNPEGLAMWFEAQSMPRYTEDVTIAANMANFVEAQKSILQAAVKLLKRHRDKWCEDSELRPISVIISTLSAHAYNGELNLQDAILGILERMPSYISEQKPYVPNPVNADEDFGERWEEKPELKRTFKQWILSALRDFRLLYSCSSKEELEKILKDTLAIKGAKSISQDVFPNDEKARLWTPKAYQVAPQRPWHNTNTR